MKLFDLHADLGHAVLKKKRAGYTDILSSFYTEGLQTGGIKAVCMASYFDGRQDWAQMQEMVLTLREAIDECPAVRLVDDARKIDWTDPYLYAMLSIEGMCGIRENVEEKLDWLYAQGVRLASLCWNERNALACGVLGGNSGLSELGIVAVRHMERIGMRIDVSHANEATFWDIFAHTSGVIIASHSNARALCPHVRNLTQRQMTAIAQRGGIIGAVAAAPFVHPVREHQDFLHYLHQVRWLCESVGCSHVGYGFDFMEYYDGVADAVQGLERPAQAIHLGNWLEKEKAYQKTAYENAVRVLSF